MSAPKRHATATGRTPTPTEWRLLQMHNALVDEYNLLASRRVGGMPATFAEILDLLDRLKVHVRGMGLTERQATHLRLSSLDHEFYLLSRPEEAALEAAREAADHAERLATFRTTMTELGRTPEEIDDLIVRAGLAEPEPVADQGPGRPSHADEGPAPAEATGDVSAGAIASGAV